MRPLFTIHAGEFVFGEHIEKKFPDARLWIPAKDTGIDFLITDSSLKRTASIQVKMSKDYRPSIADAEFENSPIAGGWLIFTHEALKKSKADIWSIVLISHERQSKPVFINIPPAVLLKILVSIHGERKDYHLHPWVFNAGKNKTCIEGRGLKSSDKKAIAKGKLPTGSRDMTQYLEDWDFLNLVIK